MTPAGSDESVVTLRTSFGAPLDDEGIRGVVVATAEAIGARHGIRVVVEDVGGDSIRVRVQGPRIVAIGLAAELRRVTNRWYRSHAGDILWRADDSSGGGW